MKKSLLALAVLGAFAGAASAQSNVTIYGKLDLGLVKTNDGDSLLVGAPGNDRLQLNEQAGSRLGFRGSEDLGGGLKANFAIEHRFTPDTGAQTSGTTFWQGFSWVGLSGDFGELRLGRDYAPAFYPANRADPWGYDTIAQLGNTHMWAGYTTTSGVRMSNMIKYNTPNFNGLTASVAASLSETEGVKNAYGFNVVYAAGPLYVGLGYDTKDETAGGKNNVFILNGEYTFGAFTPNVAYSQSKVDGDKVKNFAVGLKAALGPGELKAAIARLDPEGDDNNTLKLGVGYHYPLSKRTKLYADLGTAKTQEADRRTGVDFGIQHNF